MTKIVWLDGSTEEHRGVLKVADGYFTITIDRHTWVYIPFAAVRSITYQE